MIIKEQKTYNDYISDGWTEGKPHDYDKKYNEYNKKVMSGGKVLYKRKDGKPITNQGVDYSKFVGDYKTDNPVIKKVTISQFKDETGTDQLALSSIFLNKVPQIQKYIGGEQIFILSKDEKKKEEYYISKRSDKEKIEYVKIRFTPTNFKLIIDISGIVTTLFTATKNNETDTKKDSTSSEKIDKKDVTVPVVKKDENMGFKSRTITFGKRPKDKTPTKQCDDFPFELGCINKKIGDLSAKMFRGNRENDTYNKTVQGHIDSLGYFNDDNPNKLLTQNIYNRNLISESIKKVLKEYINKK